MSAKFHAKRLFKPSSPDSAVMVRVGASAPAKREVYVQSSPDSAVMVAVPAVGRNSSDYSVLDPYGRHGAPQAPPMRDLYARSVARKFPSYGAYAGLADKNDKYKVSNLGGKKYVWQWDPNFYQSWDAATDLEIYSPESGVELKETDDKAKALIATVVFEGSKEDCDAYDLIKGPAASSSSSSPADAGAGSILPANLVGETWNDGSYTYEIKTATEAYVPETKVKWDPSHERWGLFVSQMTSAKNLKRGPKPAVEKRNEPEGRKGPAQVGGGAHDRFEQASAHWWR